MLCGSCFQHLFEWQIWLKKLVFYTIGSYKDYFESVIRLCAVFSLVIAEYLITEKFTEHVNGSKDILRNYKWHNKNFDECLHVLNSSFLWFSVVRSFSKRIVYFSAKQSLHLLVAVLYVSALVIISHAI